MAKSGRKLGLSVLLIVTVGCFVLYSTQSVQAASYERAPEARVWINSTSGYKQSRSFFAYDQNFSGGGSVAVGDLGKDGVSEIVTGAGLGGAPHVRIFRLDGSFMNQFYAYGEGFHGGVNVAVGDVDGDGKGEIITAPKAGGGPQVRVFNSFGRAKITAGWFAYDPGYHGGVNVAVGDLDADGQAEIVTGSGTDLAPVVHVFSGNGTNLNHDYHPFADTNTGGVSVAIGNVDGGTDNEIIMAMQSHGQAWLKIYKYNSAQTVVAEWKAFPDDYTGGVNVAVADDSIIVSSNGRGGPQVKIFNVFGQEITPAFLAYEDDFYSGVSVAAGPTSRDGQSVLVTLPKKLPPDGRTDVDRYVRVDLSEQRLYAYEHGYQVNTFLISSGVASKPTPPGEYHIIRKIYDHLYSGPDYYLPHTLYNLEFKTHYYLHGAYWHHNFGHPMSHGCVNIAYPDAAWLYGWMQTGDLVNIEA